MGVRGDAARMLEDAEAGIAFEPGSPEALADAVCAMLSMSVEQRIEMGRAGRSYYQAKLAFEIGVEAIAKELELAAWAKSKRPIRVDP
jgi:glycosyltransferase involved in cell wall biosynthesis